MDEMTYRCFPKKIRIEVTEQDVRGFVKDNLDYFLDWMFKSNEFTMSEYVNDNEDLFSEFLLAGGSGA